MTAADAPRMHDPMLLDWFGPAWHERPALLGLRPERDTDLPFLRELYASTRAEELAPVPWPDAAKRDFLDQQFALQREQYRGHYRGADFLVLLDRDAPIGRMYVHRTTHELRLMDVALLPARRNRGLGTALLRRLLALGAFEDKPVTLHVEPFNPAYSMYRRHGFEHERSTGIYHFLVRAAQGPQTPVPADPLS